MAGSAAGGFMARAFESMLKECANKKYSALQSAIQTYFDSGKDINWQSNIGEIKQLTSEAPKESGSSEYNSGAENSDMGFNHSSRAPSAAENVEPTIRSASSSGSITTTLEIAGHTLGEAEADLVLNPLRLAFETKNIKMVELALDCLHKLIEYNHLEGDPGLDGGKNSKLLTDILNMVCSCVDNSAPDSTTLQVLKVLLTAIASTKIRVHGEPLVGIIRVCSNIALNSKSPINQATSKAMLTQMLGIIFFRQMESDMESSNSLETGPAHAENRSNLVVSEVSSYDHNDSKITSDDILSLKHLSRTSLRSVEGIQNFASGTDIKVLEAILKKAVDLEEGEVQRVMGAKCMSIEQRDALLLLYTLCKMGMKEGNDEVTTKARILSLELLQDLLDEVGSSSTKNLQLIDSIRAHLSYDLLRASFSQSPALFQCATGIFSVLLLRYRESLKAEIEVFFPMIVLRSLDASDLNQKLVVLRMLEKICKDPQMLVDLYINYDCDIEEPNLFERMVATLSKIAQGTQYVDPRSSNASQSLLVKTSSLQGLVNILKSLVIWEKSHRNFEKQNKESFGDVSPKDLDDSKSGEDSPSNFENLKDYKSTTEAAVSEFNQQPERGIEHLISSQLVEKTPLSATIGDYLGQHDEFALAAMHAYVESMNFSGLKFDFAIREFFKGFRIPGDAQMIDCIMEKFAECYCAQNPGLFKNADTAYVLAYAIIMLNADAHSPTGSLKMSKSDFVHMNAISSVEESAPQELLEEIYDNIVKEGIKIKDAPAGNLRNRKQDLEVNERGQLVGVLNLDCPKRNSSTDFKSQSEKILKKIQSMIKDQCGKGKVFYTSHRIELVHPMVEVVGWPLLATFSVTMGEADNTSRIGICMQGFKEGIHITHVLGVDTVRYAFLTSLLRYNFLHAPRDMRGKNVEALRTLLDICETDIYALKDSWLAILECISRLEYLVSSPAMTATLMQGSNQISRDAILHSLKELSGKPIQQVFMNSVKLPSESVIEFFTALCNVSAEELKQTPIRTFSLQKIVEISYYNMARIHMVWARIWSVLAQHFIFAGSHADEKVAMYAIDSLQRLGMKYLEHTELVTFTFQKGILKPFVTLMQSGRSESIRRLILDCVVQIIKSKAGIIKSGWQSVFMIFKTAANDDLESIVESAFENTEQVILEHFNQIVGDCFLDCLSCLIVFAKNKISVSLSLKAIALLHICEDRLAEGLMRVGSQNTVDNTADETCNVAERYWFPMLSGLSDLISDPRSEVRNCALEVLFDLLNERGSKFSSSFWENIFLQILFPIFDHVRHAGNESFISSGCERPRESTVHALQLLCDLFNTFYKDVYFMLGPLLSLLLDCAKRTDQSVVSISLGALTRLIEAGGNQFTSDDWATLLQSIRDAIYTTQPLELLNDLGIENRKHNKVLSGDLDSPSPVSLTNGDANAPNHNQETVHLPDEGSQGLPSPSNTATRPGDAGSLQRTQTIGQKIMGNMRDNLFTRSFKLKPKNFKSDAVVPSSPSKLPDATSEADAVDDEESPMMGTVRSKCITQLLLLGAIDSIQKKYWNKLNAPEKLTIMEILFSLLEFAASYNSYTNLRLRMQQIPAERPPLNLLRQELTGTCIYLDILQKITAAVNIEKEEAVEEEKLERAAKEKLVSFCEKVLREASDFQSTMEEMSNMDIHRVLELRSPIIVKVLKGMCQMNPKIFKDHLRDFYPSITKLVCCEQMEVRGALADLLSMQLTPLLQ